MMRRRHTIFLNIFLFLSLWAPSADAQVFSVDSLLNAGDSLRREYRFEESLTVYSKALEIASDTLLVQDSIVAMTVSDRILLSENGRNMTGFVYTPSVVARHMFSKEDFFLYYPLKDRSWRKAPNQLDSVGGPYARAVYAPADMDEIYFSAPDESGIRNVYKTEKGDSLWTLPSLINEQMTSSADEIYPMLSPDGKSLYFASKGLYGVGGYDIYVSAWDEEASDWSVPVNLGFPYSSPADDFLYAASEDGRYVLFASDRDCPSDSVWVYVLEEDNIPVRSEMSDPQQLKNLASMNVKTGVGKATGEVKSEIPENADTRKYMDKMAQVRVFRDSVAAYENALEEYRERYSVMENEAEKKKLAALILDREAQMPEFQAGLERAMKELQEIEMDFLFSGVVIDPDKLLDEAAREVVSEDASYVFSRMNMGEPLSLELERPEPEFDYSFRILDTACFAADVAIPAGVRYQIQIFSTAKPASLKSLKGLCPVFETRSASGRYIYRVGLFNEYKDVLSHLNAVKRVGFRNAYIVGYIDAKEQAVNKVRAEEKKRKEAAVEFFNVVIIPSQTADGVMLDGIRQQASGKDVARGEGRIIVGPFGNKAQAVALVEFVEVMGYGDASIEKLENN